MRTLVGRISRGSLVLILGIAATIVTGMLLPGKAGTIVQAAGWIALAVFLILEIGIRTTPTPDNFEGDDRRPFERSEQDPGALGGATYCYLQ